MVLMQLNETADVRRDLFVQMVDVADCLTPLSGLEPAVDVVKSGGTAYAPAGANVQEIGAGTYRVRLATQDVDTLGPAMLKISAPGAVNQYLPVQVVRFLDEVHLTKAALVNARSHDVATGVNQIKDDDGTSVLVTLSPSETNGVIHVAAS